MGEELSIKVLSLMPVSKVLSSWNFWGVLFNFAGLREPQLNPNSLNDLVSGNEISEMRRRCQHSAPLLRVGPFHFPSTAITPISPCNLLSYLSCSFKGFAGQEDGVDLNCLDVPSSTEHLLMGLRVTSQNLVPQRPTNSTRL